MKTIKTIHAGRMKLVIRSDGQVYLVDASLDFDTKPKLVARNPAGCHALAEAMAEAETFLRERKAEGNES